MSCTTLAMTWRILDGLCGKLFFNTAFPKLCGPLKTDVTPVAPLLSLGPLLSVPVHWLLLFALQRHCDTVFFNFNNAFSFSLNEALSFACLAFLSLSFLRWANSLHSSFFNFSLNFLLLSGLLESLPCLAKLPSYQNYNGILKKCKMHMLSNLVVPSPL